MKKHIQILLTLLTLGGLTACNFSFGGGGGSSSGHTATGAEQEVLLRAFANMGNMSVGSLDVEVSSASSLSFELNETGDDYVNTMIGDFVIDGSIRAKVNDLWGDTPEAHLNVTANEVKALLKQKEADMDEFEIFVDEEVSDEVINAYYDNQKVYIDASGSDIVLDLLENEAELEYSKIAFEVGSISGLEIPDLTETPAIAEDDIDDFVESSTSYLDLIPDFVVSQSGGELRFVLEIHNEDLPDIIQNVFDSMMGEIPEDVSSQEVQDQIDSIIDLVEDQVDLDVLRLEFRVNTSKNILTYFNFKLKGDVDFNSETLIEDELESEVTLVAEVDLDFTFQVHKFSESVSITLPSDLSSYYVVPLNQPDEE